MTRSFFNAALFSPIFKVKVTTGLPKGIVLLNEASNRLSEGGANAAPSSAMKILPVPVSIRKLTKAAESGIFLRKSGTKVLVGSWGNLASKSISLTPNSSSPLGKADTGKVSGNEAFKNRSAAVSMALASLRIWAFIPCPPRPVTATAVIPA
ncbi:MAG TPA: hypothetical protein EYM54_16175 [Dehalococcoidia bacterium]|nr:hypothetical protein [Dehalococcoidia bacterium]